MSIIVSSIILQIGDSAVVAGGIRSTGKKAGPPATVLTCHLPAMLGGVPFVSAGNSPLVDGNDTLHTYGNL